MSKIMITGANSGLGKECAHQLAQHDDVETIYLACRNLQKAEVARQELESRTGRSIFQIVIMDVADPDSVREAVAAFDDILDGLMMNAGGLGGATFLEQTAQGVTQMTASNLLGHVLLAEELLAENKLRGTVLYTGSEAARGVPKFGITRPELKSGSREEFISICDGSVFQNANDPMPPYAYVKLMGALWISSLARQYPDVRALTVSPGHTAGTRVGDGLPPLKKALFKSAFKVLPFFKLSHDLESGARRLVDAMRDEQYRSGIFYASKEKVLTGPMIDQSTLFVDLANESYQDNARAAIWHFLG